MSDEIDPRLSIGGNQPPEELDPQARLLRINPEALVVIGTDELIPLFDLHYPELKTRGAEILAACQKWRENHQTEAGGWKDVANDTENGELADLIRQVDSYAGEVEEARRKVKKDVYEAGLKIDGYFAGGLRDPVEDIRGVARQVGGRRVQPGPGTMQFAQTKYLNDKLERERQAREAARRAAEIEAQRKIDEANRVAEEERARKARLEAAGATADEAKEIAEAQTDKAAAQADAARQSSSLIGSYVDAPASSMVRQHTATGTTVGLTGRWDFEVTDMVAFCLSVGAQGLIREDFINKVAATSMIGAQGAKAVLLAAAQVLTRSGAVTPTMVTTDDAIIRAAIRAKTMPLREAPGLRIFQNYSASRRGG